MSDKCKQFGSSLGELKGVKEKFDADFGVLKKGEYDDVLENRNKVKSALKEAMKITRFFWDWSEGTREVLDWKNGPENYDKESIPAFSSNGKRVAAQNEYGEMLVDDEMWSGDLEGVGLDGSVNSFHKTVFSPNGESVAAIFHGDHMTWEFDEDPESHEVWGVMENDKVVALFDERPHRISYSDDSEKILIFSENEPILITRGGEDTVKLTEKYDASFMPNSHSIVHIISGDDGRVMVGVDGVKLDSMGKWDQVTNPTMSPDGKKIAAIVGEVMDPGGGDVDYSLVVNGKKWVGRTFENHYPPIFSPDSKKVAFIGDINIRRQDEKKVFFIIDAESIGKIDTTTRYSESGIFGTDLEVFSPNGKILAMAKDYGSTKKIGILHDGKSLTWMGIFFSDIKNIAFSPEGDKIMFVAREADGKYYRIVKMAEDIIKESEETE